MSTLSTRTSSLPYSTAAFILGRKRFSSLFTAMLQDDLEHAGGRPRRQLHGPRRVGERHPVRHQLQHADFPAEDELRRQVLDLHGCAVRREYLLLGCAEGTDIQLYGLSGGSGGKHHDTACRTRGVNGLTEGGL